MAAQLTKPDLSKFRNKEVRSVIEMAMALGWTVRWQGARKHVAEMISPIESSKIINVPTTNVNSDRVASWVRAIRRYSDEDKVEALIREGTVGLAQKVHEKIEAKSLEVVVDTKRGQVIDVHPEPEPEPEPALTPDEDEPAPHVGQWVRNDGTISDTVLTYRAGRQRYYQCAVCGYESTVSGASVAIHARRHRQETPDPLDEVASIPPVVHPEPVDVGDIARSIEALIAQRVSDSTTLLQRQIDRLQQERDEARVKADQYRSDLAALREILQGVRL